MRTSKLVGHVDVVVGLCLPSHSNLDIGRTLGFRRLGEALRQRKPHRQTILRLWQLRTRRGPPMLYLLPMAEFWNGDRHPATQLAQSNVRDRVRLRDLDHWRSPDLLVQPLPREVGDLKNDAA